MPRLPRSLSLVLALLSGGCLSAPMSGHFGPTAYYHVADHYRVRYVASEAAENAVLMPEAWALDNFEQPAGRPTTYLRSPETVEHVPLSRLSRRLGPNVVARSRWDLHFRRDEQRVIFLRTVPLREPWSRDSLADLMLRSVVSMASVGADGPDLLGEPPPPVTPRVRMIEQGRAEVGGRDAHYVVFDHQLLAGDASPETRRITLVGVRSSQPQAVAHANVPTLVVFGLVSTEAHTDEDRSAFAQLVSRVDFSDTF